jgi:hypothetical protein
MHAWFWYIETFIVMCTVDISWWEFGISVIKMLVVLLGQNSGKNGVFCSVVFLDNFYVISGIMHSVNLVIINTWWFLYGWNRLLWLFWGKTKNYITLYLYGIEHCLCFVNQKLKLYIYIYIYIS